MKMRHLPLVFALAAASPALAQTYDPQAEAARTRAELAQYATQADAQAAAAAAYEAQSQAAIRRIESDRNRAVIRPQVYNPQAASRAADADAAAASARASDAAMRDLDARLSAMDAYLDAARPK